MEPDPQGDDEGDRQVDIEEPLEGKLLFFPPEPPKRQVDEKRKYENQGGFHNAGIYLSPSKSAMPNTRQNKWLEKK